MTDVDCLDLLAQELGFVLKSEQRKAVEMLLRERMFSVPYQQPYLSDVCSCKEFFKFCATADSHCYLACVKKGDR